MTSQAITGPTTIRAFLFDPATGARTVRRPPDQFATEGIAGTALRSCRKLSRSVLGTVDRQIGEAVEGLLDIDLGDALVLGWRKHSALVAAARRTRGSAETEVVALATHRVTSSYTPTVDLRVDGVLVNRFEFELAAVFAVTGLAAVIGDGALAGLCGGRCLVTVTLSVEGAQLARRQHELDPALIVPVRPPLPLVDRSGVPA